jgi:hypothetical protein
MPASLIRELAGVHRVGPTSGKHPIDLPRSRGDRFAGTARLDVDLTFQHLHSRGAVVGIRFQRACNKPPPVALAVERNSAAGPAEGPSAIGDRGTTGPARLMCAFAVVARQLNRRDIS